MATRNLELEKRAVDDFVKNRGKTPSTPDDWKLIHKASYGTDLPSDLASLPMYRQASTNPSANTTPALNYQGADISDTALTGARNEALSYNTSGFLDKVKQRLQEKFKPETEVLGLGSFSATLGALDPNGVMQGISEKTGQFRRKGALALQALSTANDIYSEQAKLAYDKLNSLEEKRTAYETEQKTLESEMKDIALTIAQTGQAIPEEVLSLLPSNLRGAYEALPQIFKSGLGTEFYDDYTPNAGWSGNELLLEEGQGDAYECGYWARKLGDYGQGTPMGDSFKEKSNWVNKYGTQGTKGVGVGDLVITNGSDVSKSGKALATGHALIAGFVDPEGNVYAYESNAKGDHNVTFGRWVKPESIYGYVRGKMNPGEFEKMQGYAMNVERSGGLSGKPEGVDGGESNLDFKAKEYLEGRKSRTDLEAQFGEANTKEIMNRADELKRDGYKEEDAGDEYDIALSIFNGTSSLNVSQLPTEKREKVDEYLSKMKTEAKKSGDVLGLINASAGGKDVDSSFITSFDKAINVIYQIGDLQETFRGDNKKAIKKVGKTNGVDLNPIWGKVRKFNPWDLNAQQIKAQLQAIVPNLARGIYGEVGVLTDNDIKNYSQTLPQITSPEKVREAILGITVKSVQRAIENKLKSQVGAGRDVSGYRDMYQEIKAMSDKLLTESGLTKTEEYPLGTVVEVNGTKYKSLGNNQFEQIK